MTRIDGRASQGTAARATAVTCLASFDGEGWLSAHLSGALDRAELSGPDKGLVTELVYGVVRERLRLDFLLAPFAQERKTFPLTWQVLRAATYELSATRIPAYATVSAYVEVARQLRGAKDAGFCNAVLRRVAAGPAPAWPPGEAGAKLRTSTPDWLWNQLKAALPATELEAAAQALSQHRGLVARVNCLRATPAEVLAQLEREGVAGRPVAGVPAALALESPGELAALPSFADGLWTVQDSAAQLVALWLAPRAGEQILDACAGVAGKTCALLEACPSAHVVAADVSPAKQAQAMATAQRLGHQLDYRVLDLCTADEAALGGPFDAILLDAPCSSVGVVRRHPEAKWRPSSKEAPRHFAKVAAGLLEGLVPHLRPGGRLIFAVCSFTSIEGPLQITRLLANHPTLRLVRQQTFWPHREGHDGFFVAEVHRQP